MEPRWGKCLGRYELVAELGRGAMGVVYKARDPKIHRFVAVKTISILAAKPDEAQEYRERFFHEAQAVGRLVHPGIVTVFDVGEEPDTHTPYIVMEYVDGIPLDRLLADNGGKLPLEIALQLTEELAEALDCAHGQGIVHRDIKPANILVTKAGHAKITDFGIAKLNLSHLTLPGHVLGSPAYMSPEQLNDEPLDGRSDLFSLGVILYSLVSGHRPFQGNSVTTVCFKVTNREPLPPSAFQPELPAGLDAIVSRAMAKEPGERYQRGLEFALDLRELRNRLSADPNERLLGQTAKRNAREQTQAKTGFSGKAFEPNKAWGSYLERAFYSPRRFSSALAVHASVFIVLLGAISAFGLAIILWHRADEPLPEPPRLASTASDVADIPDVTSRVPKVKFPANPRLTIPKSAAAESKLIIGITYPFSNADVSITCDKATIYSRSLKGDPKKRLRLFTKIEGQEISSVPIDAGEHELRVHVRSDADNYDESKKISATFPPKQQKVLQVSFHGRERNLKLELH